MPTGVAFEWTEGQNGKSFGIVWMASMVGKFSMRRGVEKSVFKNFLVSVNGASDHTSVPEGNLDGHYHLRSGNTKATTTMKRTKRANDFFTFRFS